MAQLIPQFIINDCEIDDGEIITKDKVSLTNIDYILFVKRGYKIACNLDDLVPFINDGIVAYTCDEIRVDTLAYNQYYNYLLRQNEVGNCLLINAEHFDKIENKKIWFNREFLNSLIGIGPVSHIPKYVVQEK